MLAILATSCLTVRPTLYLYLYRRTEDDRSSYFLERGDSRSGNMAVILFEPYDCHPVSGGDSTGQRFLCGPQTRLNSADCPYERTVE